MALETLKILEEENICQKAQAMENCLKTQMNEVAEATGCLENIRCIGGIAAADLITETPRKGFEVFKKAVQMGAFLRPLGNTIYWFPPLNTEESTLKELAQITQRAIEVSFLVKHTACTA